MWVQADALRGSPERRDHRRAIGLRGSRRLALRPATVRCADNPDRESLQRSQRCGAEGATSPESLRQTDRSGRQRWKAAGTVPARRRGNPPRSHRAEKLSGTDDSWGQPDSAIPRRCHESTASTIDRCERVHPPAHVPDRRRSPAHAGGDRRGRRSSPCWLTPCRRRSAWPIGWPSAGRDRRSRCSASCATSPH